MSSNIQSKETDRQWNIFSSLAYLYNAFACLADGKLVEKEITKIVEVLLGWTKKEERDLKVIMAFVAQAREWLNEDINNSSEKRFGK